jgi:hypothetical protein
MSEPLMLLVPAVWVVTVLNVPQALPLQPEPAIDQKDSAGIGASDRRKRGDQHGRSRS